MAADRRARQSVTDKGVCRRLDDLQLEGVHDARGAKGKRFTMCKILTVSLLGLIAGANSLKALEDASEALHTDRSYSVGERIADNVFSYAMAHLSHADVRSCLRCQVKAEWRRKRLCPTRLGLSCIAIDGKALSTLRRHDLVRLVRAHRQAHVKELLEKRRQANDMTALSEQQKQWLSRQWQPTDDDIRAYFINEPWVQLVNDADENVSHGVIKMLRSTLISAEAAVCVDQSPIPGSTNEIGHAPIAVRELITAYGDTDMFQLLTCDAGITSLATMTLLNKHDIHYFAAVKDNQPELLKEAKRLLDGMTQFSRRSEERSKGKLVVHELYVVDTPEGYLQWTHMQRMVRSRRIVKVDGVIESDNDRYYATSLGASDISLNDLHRLNRCHWRCENEGHWTADVSFLEDAKRATLSRTPQTMVPWSYMRMIALNIQAVMRSVSRLRDPDTEEITVPSWRRIAWHFLSLLFDMTLDTSLFDRTEVQKTCAAAPS